MLNDVFSEEWCSNLFVKVCEAYVHPENNLRPEVVTAQKLLIQPLSAAP
jgi:hypothetical protein